jgi:hypothetical protein
MVRQVAALFNEQKRAEKILKPWAEGCSLVWSSKTHPGCQIALSAVRFENPEAARAYYHFALDLQRKQDTTCGSGCTASRRVLESLFTELNLPGVELAVRNDKRFQFATGTPPVSVSVVLACNAGQVVECTWYGAPADLAWARKALAKLFHGFAK